MISKILFGLGALWCGLISAIGLLALSSYNIQIDGTLFIAFLLPGILCVILSWYLRPRNISPH